MSVAVLSESVKMRVADLETISHRDVARSKVDEQPGHEQWRNLLVTLAKYQSHRILRDREKLVQYP